MRTALHDRHVELGAKMVDFAGWEMPVQYTGVIEEHRQVRENVGIFDVSHMGRILIEGSDAGKFLDYISTNTIADKRDGMAIYTVLPTQSGGCVDDVIIYKQNAEHYFMIANASNREKDKQHLIEHSTHYDVQVTDRYQEEGILAIQGPKAKTLLARRFPEVDGLKPMWFTTTEWGGTPMILSSTGYTGSGGCEVYAPRKVICELWDWCLQEGAKPIGLAARDTLRLEMGFALYGHELTENIAPNESVSAWTVKWDKPEFLGKEAMQKLEGGAAKRKEYGIVLQGKGIAREGFQVFQNHQQIGIVTSGTHSPSLNQAIAIILVDTPLNPGDHVEVQVRSRRVKAEVVKLPFYAIKK